LTAIKRAFSLGTQASKILVKPHIPMLRENNVRRGFFERAQFEALRHALPDYLKPVALFAYIPGWQVPSEVLKLQWSNFDFLGGQVRLDPGTTKNGEGRLFPFTAEIRALFEAQYKTKPKDVICPWVFHRDGKPIWSFYKAWARAGYDAGLPCVIHFKRDRKGEILRYKQGAKKGEPIIEKIDAENIPHDFRRTPVRNLLRAGIPERVAMQLTGHKTRSVFGRYNIVSETDLTDAARRLDLATGTVLGTVAPIPVTLPTENSANLLHFNSGPVAQKDRAAVS
jgi:integrase